MDSEFDASTDTKHRFKLESKILYALWKCGVARGGSETAVEVRTVLVGHGADIEISGKSSEGKAPGKIKGKVFNNRFTGRLPIPEDVDPEADVWFEAKLPKHGLMIESNAVPAAPPILCSSLEWSCSEVRRGDVVSLTGSFTGARSEEEATVIIYEHDPDGRHDKVAEIPVILEDGRLELDWEFRYDGDTAEIPTEEELQPYDEHYRHPEYFFTVKIDGVELGREDVDSGLMRFMDYIDIRLINDDGSPAEGIRYRLHLADGGERSGQLDENGSAREEEIPPGPCRAEFERPDSPEAPS